MFHKWYYFDLIYFKWPLNLLLSYHHFIISSEYFKTSLISFKAFNNCILIGYHLDAFNFYFKFCTNRTLFEQLFLGITQEIKVRYVLVHFP